MTKWRGSLIYWVVIFHSWCRVCVFRKALLFILEEIMKLEISHESATTAQMPGSAVVSCRHFTGRFHGDDGSKQLANALEAVKAACTTCEPPPHPSSCAYCCNQNCICLKVYGIGYYRPEIYCVLLRRTAHLKPGLDVVQNLVLF